MSKQPYIPLYIGDWQKDTNTISLEAEGALLKLIFKMWDAKDKGELSISLNQLSILLKKGREISAKILQELKENEVLNIDFLENETVKIQSRRMLKDIEKSKSYSDRGKLGGRPKKAKRKLNESKGKANSDNDIDNDSENENDNSVTVLSETDFEIFWDAYDKKTGDKKKLKVKWDKLTEKERVSALAYIPVYVAATPDKQYRKNPDTFLNNKSWNDEIIQRNETRNSGKPNASQLFTEALGHLKVFKNGNDATGS